MPVQSMRTKAPGDSKEMVAARRAFLNAGYYGIFGKAVGELCAEMCIRDSRVALCIAVGEQLGRGIEQLLLQP